MSLYLSAVTSMIRGVFFFHGLSLKNFKLNIYFSIMFKICIVLPIFR